MLAAGSWGTAMQQASPAAATACYLWRLGSTADPVVPHAHASGGNALPVGDQRTVPGPIGTQSSACSQRCRTAMWLAKCCNVMNQLAEVQRRGGRLCGEFRFLRYSLVDRGCRKAVLAHSFKVSVCETCNTTQEQVASRMQACEVRRMHRQHCGLHEQSQNIAGRPSCCRVPTCSATPINAALYAFQAAAGSGFSSLLKRAVCDPETRLKCSCSTLSGASKAGTHVRHAREVRPGVASL